MTSFRRCFIIAFALFSALIVFIMIYQKNPKQLQMTSYVFTGEDGFNKSRESLHNFISNSFLGTLFNKESCPIPRLFDLNAFYDYGKREKMRCNNLTEIGGNKEKQNDGSKFVCFDDRYKIVPGNCVVLSFGINNEWSFDDDMDYYGCNVYAFDPTMEIESFYRSPRTRFFNLGLSSFEGIKKIGNKTCKVDRYQNILKMLNLTDKPIDYLKMDIEGSEMDFLEDVLATAPSLLQNVKQIGMEIHPGLIPNIVLEYTIRHSSFYRLWKGMHQLGCLGFKLVQFEKNRVERNDFEFEGRNVSCCYEVMWAKDPV